MVKAKSLVVSEYAQEIKSATQQNQGDANLRKQYLLESTDIVKSVIRAVSNDDEVIITLSTRGSLPDQELIVPPYAVLDLQKMQMNLSELLHVMSNCLTQAEPFQKGLSLEENTDLGISSSQEYADLLHFILQELLRIAREARHDSSLWASREIALPNSFGRGSKKIDFLLFLLRESIIPLDTDKIEYQHIFKEFMKLLFIYVAQSLHFLEFTHSELDDIEYQIKQSAHLDYEFMRRENEQTYATRPIIIIKILETIFMLAPSLYRNSPETSCSCIANHPCPIKKYTKQIRFCKRHLQELLAEKAFGYASDLRLERFSISPTVSRYQVDSCPIKNVGVAEWFKSSLWHLVGWDILQLIPTHIQE